MKAAPFFLLALGLLTATPVAGQAIVCGGVRLPLAPGLPAVRDTAVKRVADSIPCIKTNGTPSTQLRNRLSLRSDSLSRRVPKVDTVLVPVTVVDTVYLPVPVPIDTLPPIILPPDPPTGEVFDSVLSGVRVGDVVVPDGKTYLVGSLEIRRGSLRTVDGTIALRDGSHLLLTGGVSTEYVGGGMYWTPELGKTDFGVWVGGPNATGKLDVRCTAKTRWGRAPASDWSATDELWHAPINVDDFTPHRYTLGLPIPRADSLVPPTEVVNVTAACSIEGVGHIHVHSNAVQRIENVRLQGLGISNANGPVLGRYALHFHMSGDGSRGSTIRGVACVQSGGRCFVPHASHGVTLTDNVCLESLAACFWWDQASETNDVLVDRLAVLGVKMGGEQGIVLDAGSGNEIKNSFCAGVRGNDQSNCFTWPEPTPNYDPVLSKLVWKFDQGNVAHNNYGAGVSFWNNEQAVQTVSHVVANYVAYRNHGMAVNNGAYVNCNHYHNILSFEDGIGAWFGGLNHPAVAWGANSGVCDDGARPARLENATLRSKDGAALVVGGGAVTPATAMVLEDLTLIPGPGQAKVLVLTVGGDSKPWRGDFIRSGVTPDDITFKTEPDKNEGSEVRIDVEGDPLDPKPWEWIVRIVAGKKVVTTP